MKKLLFWTVIFLFMGISASFLFHHADLLGEIKNISPISFVVIFLGITLSLFLNALVLFFLAKPFGITDKILTFFWLSAAASFLNFVAPLRAGAGFRAWFMKKKYQLDYPCFVSSLFGNYVIVFATLSLSGIGLFGILFPPNSPQHWSALLLFCGIFLGTFFLCTSSLFRRISFFAILQKIVNGWEKIRTQKKIIFFISIATLGNLFITAEIFWILFLEMGLNVSFFQSLGISVFSSLGIFFLITPGALGISESFAVLGAIILGIPIETTFLVSLTKRAVEICTLLILGPLGKIILFRDLKK